MIYLLCTNFRGYISTDGTFILPGSGVVRDCRTRRTRNTGTADTGGSGPQKYAVS